MANAFCHIELTTDDDSGAKKFYKKLFPSWKTTDMKMPAGVYTMINVGVTGAGKSVAAGGGIQKKMLPDAPSGWMPYVQVANVKQSVEKAKKLGATVIMDAEDIGMGSIAIFVDPTGCTFGIWAPAPKKAAKKPAKRKAVKRAKR
jgi:predicted enzyme related to lactoylglutathione lyase